MTAETAYKCNRVVLVIMGMIFVARIIGINIVIICYVVMSRLRLVSRGFQAMNRRKTWMRQPNAVSRVRQSIKRYRSVANRRRPTPKSNNRPYKASPHPSITFHLWRSCINSHDCCLCCLNPIVQIDLGENECSGLSRLGGKNKQVLAAVAVKTHLIHFSPISTTVYVLNSLKVMGVILHKTTDGRVALHGNKTLLSVDDALVYAASKGDEIGVRVCRAWGATSMERALIKAAARGYDRVVLTLFRMLLTPSSQKQRESTLLHWAALEAAKHGHENIILLCGLKDNNCLLIEAAANGHNNIVELIYKQGGATAFNDALRSAAKRGHAHMVHTLSAMGATAFNQAMIIAARCGHIDFMGVCYTLGATDIDSSMKRAAWNGHRDIVIKCREWGATSFNVAMKEAARGGHEEIVAMCHEWGATDVNEAMRIAAYNGHESIVVRCHGWGATNFNRSMLEAVFGGHEDIVVKCREWGATNLNVAMMAAARWGHESIMIRCCKWGATNFDGAMMAAVRGGHKNIVIKCREWGATN